MKLYEAIRTDMVEAYKRGYTQTSSTLKVLLSDIQRDPNKDYSDSKVITVIRQTISMAEEAAKSGLEEANDTVALLKNYLPKQISADIIRKAIEEVDFSKLKNKYQAIGIIKKKFPNGSVDGNTIKELIEEKFN